MGLSRAAAGFLIDTAKQLGFSGRALTLGIQNLSFDVLDLPDEIQSRFTKQQIKDKDFLKSIGFDHVKALDIDDYEGAEYLADLNQPGVDIGETFDCVFDTGTLEHVFHIPNALTNLSNLLKNNGRIIHVLPVANRVDHGFYMFSPTFFWDYYQANNFVIERSLVLRTFVEQKHYRWQLFEYFPSNLDWLSMGKLDDGAYGMIFIVKKVASSTSGIVPQQRRSRNMWTFNQSNKNTISEIKKCDIDRLNGKVWLFGYNHFSEQLASMLQRNSVEVAGFVDSLKYGFDTFLGPVYSPEKWLLNNPQKDCNLLFCTRSQTNENRNRSTFNSLCKRNNFLKGNVFFDEELHEHQQLSEDYKKLCLTQSANERPVDNKTKLAKVAFY